MQLCDYGCGKEGKYQFKNGKRCCSKSYQLCSFQRKRISIQIKKIWKNPNSVFNSDSYKEKRSNMMKEIWSDPNSEFNSVSYRKSLSDGLKGIWDNPNSVFNSDPYKEKISIGLKEAWKNQDNGFNSISRKEKLSLTIEKINIKYPFFSKIEEMRYNPDKPGEKEIQVHCKNHNCKNSKEKGGWFTPTINQISHRRYVLEYPDGNDGGHFYCCQECKDECPLYRFRNDPFLLSEFKRYRNIVYKETGKTIKLYNHKIKNIEIRGREYSLDHKYSIYEGFVNNVNPKLISHWKNLEIIPSNINSSKQTKCSISLNELEKETGISRNQIKQ